MFGYQSSNDGLSLNIKETTYSSVLHRHTIPFFLKYALVEDIDK